MLSKKDSAIARQELPIAQSENLYMGEKRLIVGTGKKHSTIKLHIDDYFELDLTSCRFTEQLM
jgi:hypothetical protein